MSAPRRAPVVVFDVNETLLDLGALRPAIAAALGDAGALEAWFGRVIRTAMTLTAVGGWADFAAVADAALVVEGAARGAAPDADARRAVLEGMRALPPHPDVAPALERLAAAGLRLAALTNSPQAGAEAQLAHAGVAPRLEAILSVDAVRAFKPHPAVYRSAAAALGVQTSEIVMVAAHDWDVAGAMATGATGALVLRGGGAPSPVLPEPTIVGRDLVEVADRLVASPG
ncbi:MAG TPA: haloacid dehalogenase type II [Miltoncostaeaceae bacterium]|nr:haloacid dehalogenase type II [Miltoncostaeaceae bacterium]